MTSDTKAGLFLKYFGQYKKPSRLDINKLSPFYLFRYHYLFHSTHCTTFIDFLG